MTIKGRTVGFVGAGNMGEALIKGGRGERGAAKSIYTADCRGDRLAELAKLFGIQPRRQLRPVTADVVILAVSRIS